jgi:hypothetical protein
MGAKRRDRNAGQGAGGREIALYVISREGLGTIQDYTVNRGRLLDAMKKYVVSGMPPAPPGTEAPGEGMMETPARRIVGPEG